LRESTYELVQINAAITTQLLLSFFDVEGVIHYGIAGNANPDLHIGDVAIPQYWAHTGLWNWQVFHLSTRFLDSSTQFFDVKGVT